MKGIIFNILEAYLLENAGEEKLDHIIASAELSTRDPFVAPGTYPDEDFLKIVGQATEEFGWSHAEFFRHLGKFAFFKLAERYPGFVSPHRDPKEFLKTIDQVVHVEVRKLYTDTYLPTFTYREPSPRELVITYYSKRKMYDLMEGLIEGVATYFAVGIEQTHRIYTEDEIEYCDFYLNFLPDHEKRTSDN
ncbi:hypothetical protein GGR28_002144 [Lewinella aquimaris]|uniref:Heme NO-binding domain-containing protein n=1 Tax=Neolewinella aquimaris TaxID=1835722 RepID=A0A840ECJ2_9BACT|nr:heme NO-binding domain-containing protein [Neolewinella aquimaris]MBB4079519.1 hypothetical protein [Neolewinella aquimaris]